MPPVLFIYFFVVTARLTLRPLTSPDHTSIAS
jgi:hypothetical protein